MSVKKSIVVNIKDKKKAKSKVIVSKKRPKFEKISLEDEIAIAIPRITQQYPDMYKRGVTYKGFSIIYKKIKREIKVTNARNIFMIFENTKPEEFVIPIIINNATQGKSGALLDLQIGYRDLGMKEISIQNIDEMIEKLNEII
jgi:hypothetical protein